MPEGIDEGEVRAYLAGLTGVEAVHALHIWPMRTTETALTAHLVLPGGHAGAAEAPARSAMYVMSQLL